jgi:hypothetical protein
MSEPKRTISVKQITADIHNGLNSEELKNKYGLSERNFYAILDQLAQKKLISNQHVAALSKAAPQIPPKPITRKPVPGRLQEDQRTQEISQANHRITSTEQLESAENRSGSSENTTKTKVQPPGGPSARFLLDVCKLSHIAEDVLPKIKRALPEQPSAYKKLHGISVGGLVMVLTAMIVIGLLQTVLAGKLYEVGIGWITGINSFLHHLLSISRHNPGLIVLGFAIFKAIILAVVFLLPWIILFGITSLIQIIPASCVIAASAAMGKSRSGLIPGLAAASAPIVGLALGLYLDLVTCRWDTHPYSTTFCVFVLPFIGMVGGWRFTQTTFEKARFSKEEGSYFDTYFSKPLSIDNVSHLVKLVRARDVDSIGELLRGEPTTSKAVCRLRIDFVSTSINPGYVEVLAGADLVKRNEKNTQSNEENDQANKEIKPSVEWIVFSEEITSSEASKWQYALNDYLELAAKP